MAQARRSLAALARATRAGATAKSVPEDFLALCPSKLAGMAQNSAGVRSVVTLTNSNLVSRGSIGRGFSSGITYPASEAFVGKPAPNFSGTAVVGGEFSSISLDDYKGKWVCLFFYPKDWTFVCPTEIIAFSDRAKEFEELGCQLIAASTDTEESHLAWIKTPRRKGGLGVMQIPVLADTTKEIAAKYGCLIPELGIALRGLYIINPEGVLEQIIVNNLPIGRSVDEAKRLLQAIQFVREHGEVCPAGWTPGAATMVADPERSMDYFSQQEEHADEVSPGLPSLTSPQAYQDALNNNDKVVIDFYAPWCGKCKMISPTVEALAEANPSVKFFKVDTTGPGMEELKDSLGVKALPTFKFYKAGSEAVDEVIGYKKRPLEDAVTALAGNFISSNEAAARTVIEGYKRGDEAKKFKDVFFAGM